MQLQHQFSSAVAHVSWATKLTTVTEGKQCKWWWWLFPCVRGFWENVWQFIPCLCFFFFLVNISSCTLFPLFRPGSVHIGSASCDDCDQVFPDKLRVSLFPDRFPHYAWTTAKSAHSDSVGSKCVCVLRCNLSPPLLAEGPGSFTCQCSAVIQGLNGHQIRVSTQSWLQRRKFSHCSCKDLNSQPFDHESSALTNTANICYENFHDSSYGSNLKEWTLLSWLLSIAL